MKKDTATVTPDSGETWPPKLGVLPRSMTDDLGLDKFRSIYNQAQWVADAAALLLQRLDGVIELRRNCHHVAQVVGKAPGKQAKLMESTSYPLWGGKI